MHVVMGWRDVTAARLAANCQHNCRCVVGSILQFHTVVTLDIACSCSLQAFRLLGPYLNDLDHMVLSPWHKCI